MCSRHRGRWIEKQVSEYFLNQGCERIAENLKTPFAEVDLLFKAPEGGYFIIEVKKSLAAEIALSARQARRLSRAVQYLSRQFETIVRCHLAVVDPELNLDFIEDVLTELV